MKRIYALGICLAMVSAGFAQEKEVTNAFLDLERQGTVNESESVMRVKCSAQELAALLAQQPDCGYFCFPESRELAMRSTEFVPQRWAATTPEQRARFTGKAQPGEFYTYQLAVYPVKGDLRNVRIVFSDLKNKQGKRIGARGMRCFNTGGVNKDGQEFVKRVDVPQNSLQALWVGVSVPGDAAGEYEGKVTIVADGVPKTTVGVTLSVGGEAVKNQGDDEGWRHSRLRWLDSRAGEGEEPTRPYIPVEVKGNEIHYLGGRMVLNVWGLPERIVTNYNSCNAIDRKVENDVLAEGMQFKVGRKDEVLDLEKGKLVLKKVSDGRAEWTSKVKGNGLELLCEGRFEFDGFAHIRMSLIAKKDITLDIQNLVIPYTPYVSRYFMGLGEKGGFFPSGGIAWAWDTTRHQDEFWVGNVNAGLKIKLKDENYRRPLVNVYYALGRLRQPSSWGNVARQVMDKEAGIVILPPGKKGAIANILGDEKVMRKGDTLHYDMELLITPVKPLDMEHQVKDRFYHSNSDVSAKYIPEALEKGANMINVHHKKDIYPFINYPYYDASLPDLKKFIEEAHSKGLKVRTYYTTRELTVKIPEIWALRSLGGEVIMDGPGKDARTLIHRNGPNPWLNENFGSHFIPAWYNAFREGKYKGDMDISVITTPDSRWNNYYLEGLDWMVKNIGLDGVYIDDSALDRETLKRARRLLDADGKHRTVDMHSWNHMNQWAGYANSLLMYTDLLPYADRLWLGEGFKYTNTPDFWLVEMSGIPFGLMSETLDARNYWRGMTFCMTPRLPWSGDPRPLWKLYDDFGMEEAVMYGFWNADSPLRSDNEAILPTIYVKKDKAVIVVANWTDRPAACRLSLDTGDLGFIPSKVSLPEMAGIQAAGQVDLNGKIEVEGNKGLFILLEK